MTHKKSVCEWNPLSCVLNLDTKLGERPNWNPSIKVSLLLHLVLYEEPDNNELGWPAIYYRDAAGFSNPGGLAVMGWA